MKTPAVSPHRGQTVIAALILTLILGGFIAVAASYTQSLGGNVARTERLEQARSVAEGCLELAFSGWRQVCRRNPVAPPTSAELAGIPTPQVSDFSEAPGLVIKRYQVRPVTPTWQPISGANTRPAGVVAENAATISFFYEAEVEVEMDGPRGRQSARLRRMFEKQNISPWAFAVFFNDLLEIHPGPSFVIQGAVHSNGSLYTGSSKLDFRGKVTYVGDWEIAFAPGDTVHRSAPGRPLTPANLPPARDVALPPFGLDAATIFSATDTNPNNDGYREYIERPQSGATDPIAADRYYNQADIKIEVDAANAVTIRRRDGTVLSPASTAQEDRDLYAAVRGAVTTGEFIQDNREGAQMRLVSLDVAALAGAKATGAIPPSFNGVLYVADSSADPAGAGAKRGVRLRNGGRLPDGGLTVVSENPLYVQGDYNSGMNPDRTNQPRSNTNNDSTQPTATGYTRQPAALIGDAVNILSNGWQDANSGLSLSSRVASNTTVNAAILSGIVPTGDGVGYSGGVENFPRFLETWNNQTFTYYGSMVQLYRSQQSIGAWGSGNVYNPPVRRWFFDTRFYTNPPPGPLIVTKFERGPWSIR